jgi:hypothetical protein
MDLAVFCIYLPFCKQISVSKKLKTASSRGPNTAGLDCRAALAKTQLRVGWLTADRKPPTDILCLLKQVAAFAGFNTHA